MSNLLFPTNIPGLSWEYTISELFDNVYYPSATPGVESALSKGSDPTFRLKLKFDFLRQNAAGTDELAILRSFWRKMQGGFDSFLVDLSAITKNPKDGAITGQALTVDANNYAPIVRTYSGVDETIYEINAITQITANGTPVPLDIYHAHNDTPSGGEYSYWDSSGQRTYAGSAYPGVVVQFGSAPAAPVLINFSWYYRMRFDKDQADYESFLFQLYDLQEIDLVTRRNP